VERNQLLKNIDNIPFFDCFLLNISAKNIKIQPRLLVFADTGCAAQRGAAHCQNVSCLNEPLQLKYLWGVLFCDTVFLDTPDAQA